jgi:hypothetical protein
MLDQNGPELFGGGEDGETMAKLLHQIKFDLPLDDLIEPAAPAKIRSGHGPAESSPPAPGKTR